MQDQRRKLCANIALVETYPASEVVVVIEDPS